MAKSILIVDDQEVMAGLWRIKFEQNGFIVASAKDGLQALDVMNKNKFDAILLDIYMPNMNGFEVLSKKHETLNGETPTYVITSSTKDDDQAHALELGARESFLKYQTSPKEIAEIVKRELKIS
jgi:CheY-like chemotaxis protein